MERYLCRVLICLLGLGLMSSKAFEVAVKDDSNTTCIYASLKVNFTIQYENNNGTNINTTLAAPDNVNTTGSTCEGALLVVNFGNGHSWSLNFTRNNTEYSVNMIVFTYNTNDSTLFKDAKQKGLITTVKSVNEPIPINETYTCLHEEVVAVDHVVQVYWNVSLLAYAQGVTLKKEFHCNGDISTTQAPTTHMSTTTSTNTTSTTATPTTKPVDKPIIGNYSVLNGNETCLLASMGLQLNASLLVDGQNVWTQININPYSTNSSGSCGNDSAVLRLNDNGTTIVEFSFFIKKKNFILQEVNVSIANASGFSHRTVNNLSLWEASVKNSYLCHKEQLIKVSEDLSVNTFDVRVQPFGVHNATFSTAEDCFADQNFTVPIVVGAALGALIVLVMVAYFIGRRNRRSAGYEHF